MEIEVIETSKGKMFCFSMSINEPATIVLASNVLEAPVHPKWETIKLIRNSRVRASGLIREVGTHAAGPRFDMKFNNREFHTRLMAEDFEAGDKLVISRDKKDKDAEKNLHPDATKKLLRVLELRFEEEYWSSMLPLNCRYLL